MRNARAQADTFHKCNSCLWFGRRIAPNICTYMLAASRAAKIAAFAAKVAFGVNSFYLYKQYIYRMLLLMLLLDLCGYAVTYINRLSVPMARVNSMISMFFRTNFHTAFQSVPHN